MAEGLDWLSIDTSGLWPSRFVIGLLHIVSELTMDILRASVEMMVEKIESILQMSVGGVSDGGTPM